MSKVLNLTGIILYCSLWFGHLNCQELNQNQTKRLYEEPEDKFSIDYFGVDYEFLKIESFAGVIVGGQYNRINYDASFTISLGQLNVARFFPRLQLTAGYYFLNKDFIKLGPILRFGESTYNYGPRSKDRNFNHEYLFGYKTHVGAAKLKVQHSISAGIISSGHYDIVLNKYRYGSNYTFTFSMGFTYDL